MQDQDRVDGPEGWRSINRQIGPQLSLESFGVFFIAKIFSWPYDENYRLQSMNVIQPTELPKIISVLRQGGVVVFPTETSYGLGCDPRNLAALGKIYRIKGRETSKALPLVACSYEQVTSFFDVPPLVQDLVKRYWPGPLTVLLEPLDMVLRRQIPVFKDGLAAVRVSSHPFVQALACAYGFPLTATSANVSGQEPCISAKQAEYIFATLEPSRRPDLIVDGGELPLSEPSTIVKISAQGQLEVVRQGAIRLSDSDKTG